MTHDRLLKVYLALNGFSVYIDIESLRIGRFDENLLISIRKSTNFILVLTANALDRCIGDTHCNDWVHKVCMTSTMRGRWPYILTDIGSNQLISSILMSVAG